MNPPAAPVLLAAALVAVSIPPGTDEASGPPGCCWSWSAPIPRRRLLLCSCLKPPPPPRPPMQPGQGRTGCCLWARSLVFLHATSAGPPGGFETLRRRVRNRRWSCACVVRWGCCVVRMGQPVPCWAGQGHGRPGAERGALMLLLLLALVALFFGRGGGPGRCDGGQEHEAAAASQHRRPLRTRRFQAARPKRPPPAVAGTSGHTPAPS